jgi:putative acetyltransferase
MQIKIRLETISDIQKIKEINDLAFGGESESKLVEAIRQSENFIPELSLVAEDNNGDVVGHILMSVIHIKTSNALIPTLGLAPMAVHPDYQRKGIGSLLVKKVIESARDIGYKHIAVLGNVNFYPKFGFVPSKTKGIQSPFPVPDEVFMVMELVEGSLSEIQGKVQYPQAFNVVS